MGDKRNGVCAEVDVEIKDSGQPRQVPHLMGFVWANMLELNMQTKTVLCGYHSKYVHTAWLSHIVLGVPVIFLHGFVRI